MAHLTWMRATTTDVVHWCDVGEPVQVKLKYLYILMVYYSLCQQPKAHIIEFA